MADLYVPDIETLRDQFLSDFELSSADYGVENPPIEPGTDWYALAVAEANLHGISCQNVALAQKDTTPIEAEGPKLDEWRQTFGLPVVPAGRSRGRIIVETTGVASIQADVQLTHATGTRYATLNTKVNIQNNEEVDIICLDPGEAGNLEPGEKLQFVSPPNNVKTVAYVSEEEPLTGGTDDEDDDHKRDRVLNRTENAPGGGNWGQLVQIALDSSPAVQGAYAYSALGGPASTKVVITRRFDEKRRIFSRAPSDTLVTLVRNAIQTNAADSLAVVVQAAADANLDVSMQMSIPDSILAGGNGRGWLDATPWPSLTPGETRVTVTTVTDGRTIIVNALTTTTPIAGQTRISWFSPVDKTFQTRLVTTQSGGTGAWTLTLDKPLTNTDGSLVAVGDYISPAAANMVAYAKTWRTIMQALGPGENTADSARLPRAARHPTTDTKDSPEVTAVLLKQFGNAHVEVLDIAYAYRSATTPAVPLSISVAPNIFIPRHLGIYPI